MGSFALPFFLPPNIMLSSLVPLLAAAPALTTMPALQAVAAARPSPPPPSAPAGFPSFLPSAACSGIKEDAARAALMQMQRSVVAVPSAEGTVVEVPTVFWEANAAINVPARRVEGLAAKLVQRLRSSPCSPQWMRCLRLLLQLAPRSRGARAARAAATRRGCVHSRVALPRPAPQRARHLLHRRRLVERRLHGAAAAARAADQRRGAVGPGARAPARVLEERDAWRAGRRHRRFPRRRRRPRLRRQLPRGRRGDGPRRRRAVVQVAAAGGRLLARARGLG